MDASWENSVISQFPQKPTIFNFNISHYDIFQLQMSLDNLQNQIIIPNHFILSTKIECHNYACHSNHIGLALCHKRKPPKNPAITSDHHPPTISPAHRESHRRKQFFIFFQQLQNHYQQSLGFYLLRKYHKKGQEID